MMSEFAVLDISLHGQQIGTITHLPGDKNLLTFSPEYIDNQLRNTLSLSFKDRTGDFITDIKTTRTRLPTFFSNLLPEGHMREYLAKQARVSSTREFYLLGALGKDLPGALQVIPSTSSQYMGERNEEMEAVIESENKESILRFSLAGIQLKFSAIWENEGGLTIPVHGIGGSWIVKMPSSVYSEVPENEYTMMEMARRVGINVPETALVSLEQVHGLPQGIGLISNNAFVIKRFDRAEDGGGIHMEDFAQIFGVYPERKYQAASYRNIAEVIWSEMGEDDLIEFMRRFVFNALIGNGDMHIKNWSVIYPDKRKPVLAPAYDFVSTIPYIPQDELALNFVDSKSFQSLNYEQFKRFASKAKLPETTIIQTVKETVERFKQNWSSIHNFPLNREIVNMIDKHLMTIPVYQG